MARIELQPLGKILTVEDGAPLQDVLFAEGVEFPCGGRGRCKGCRIQLREGNLPPTPEDQRIFSQAELTAGWRLACRCRAQGDLKIDLAQWETPVLSDSSTFAFMAREGLGVAIDLGTTTLAAQLLDLQTGHVLAVRTGLNAQATHGTDIMSRVEHALQPEGEQALRDSIREQLGSMITGLLADAGQAAGALRRVIIVGNTVMHHLFCGIPVEPMSHHPFEPVNDGLQSFSAQELAWKFDSAIQGAFSSLAPLGERVGVRGIPSNVHADAPIPPTQILFLPCLGGFVGSDILAGILATRLDESHELQALIDLGTNGEIVVGNRERMLCASTAAGPAFEGARISMGMRAATGAISQVTVEGGRLHCHVIGNGTARGLCGSGLVDAASAALELGLMRPTGRLMEGKFIPLTNTVTLTQADIRELQLAKGAIAAGLRLLVQQWGARMEDLTRIHLAGAFGNYINRASALRIGLLPFDSDRVIPAGNTALLGAKMALFLDTNEAAAHASLRQKVQHASLNEDLAFHEIYAEEMRFPDEHSGI